MRAVNKRQGEMLAFLCCSIIVKALELKGTQSRSNGLKSLAKLFKFVICNPCQSSPSLTILVPLWFIIISLIFFYLYKVLFSGFLQFNGNFVDGQKNSKYRDYRTSTLSVMRKIRSGNQARYLTPFHY